MTFYEYLYIIGIGNAAGFLTGFISWAIGYTVYGIAKFFKISI